MGPSRHRLRPALWSLRDGTKALIDVRLFKDRSFTIAGGLTVLSGFTMFSELLLLPLYFQQVRGASIIEAGLHLVPQCLGAAVLIIFAKKLLANVPVRWRITGGFILMAVGTVPFAFPGTHAITHAPHTAAGLATAFGTAFWWTVAFTVVPIALACLLPKAKKQ